MFIVTGQPLSSAESLLPQILAAIVLRFSMPIRGTNVTPNVCEEPTRLVMARKRESENSPLKKGNTLIQINPVLLAAMR